MLYQGCVQREARQKYLGQHIQASTKFALYAVLNMTQYGSLALTYFKIYIAIERPISKNNQPFAIIDNRIYVCYSSKISAQIYNVVFGCQHCRHDSQPAKTFLAQTFFPSLAEKARLQYREPGQARIFFLGQTSSSLDAPQGWCNIRRYHNNPTVATMFPTYMTVHLCPLLIRLQFTFLRLATVETRDLCSDFTQGMLTVVIPDAKCISLKTFLIQSNIQTHSDPNL